METRQKLDSALKEAMRSGDEVRKQNIRMVISAIKLAEVEKGNPLDEAGVIGVIQKEIKSRNEAMQDAQKAGRLDLISKAQGDISILEAFLPSQLSANDLEKLVQNAIEEVGAKSLADMGKVMKVLMPKIQGRAAGDQVSQAVRKYLQ